MTTPKIKITYFDIEGAAEPVRLAFVLAGVPFEDDRIKFPEWGELKPKTPHGTVPVMTIDDGPMKTQSGAMLRYAATLDKTGALYPTDKMYDVEQAIGVIGDMTRSWTPNLYISMRPKAFGYPEDFPKTDEGKAKIASMRKEWVETELPKWLGFLSDMIDANGGTYLCGGDKPTIADCMAVPTIRNFTRGHIDHVDVDCVAKCNPKVAAYVERFCALPEIKGRYSSGLGA
mmetsp:Transcript_38659/g.84837  ORF Transcript_38659/g.84837 Transcript_38659/m.84837 type:complete len:230 (-) Transcript_38659:292-981(-)